MSCIPHEELLEACRIAAQIVDRDGATFLPIFERLEREVEAAHNRTATMLRARDLAASSHGAGIQ